MSALPKARPLRKTSSQAMEAYREKCESVETHTMPLVRDLHARIDRAAKKAGMPKSAPREIAAGAKDAVEDHDAPPGNAREDDPRDSAPPPSLPAP